MEPRTTPSGETVRQEIVAEAAAVRGVDPLDLDPLYDAIDPDAVGALVESGFAGKIEFRYAGCSIVVRGDGQIDARTHRGRRDDPSTARGRDGNDFRL